MLAEYIDKIRGPYASRVSTLTRSTALCWQSTLTRSGGVMLAEYFDKIRRLYASRVLTRSGGFMLAA